MRLLLCCLCGAVGGMWTAAVSDLVIGVHSMWVNIPLSCLGGFILTWSVMRVLDKEEK